jgi:predicted nucleotide-binding protein
MDSPITVNGQNVSFGGSGRTGNTYNGNARRAPDELADGPTGHREGKARRVFVVYGRDRQVYEEMLNILRALGLEPLEWERLINDSRDAAPYVGDNVALAVTQASAAVVLLTPDDVVYLHPWLHKSEEAEYEVREACQPRPNVLIELGMALAAFPKRTVVVSVGDLRTVSDLVGRDIIRFDGSAETVHQLVSRLRAAGLPVHDLGPAWYRTDRFKDWNAYRRRPRPRPGRR